MGSTSTSLNRSTLTRTVWLKGGIDPYKTLHDAFFLEITCLVLWGEIFQAATIILNLLSTKSNPKKTPIELFLCKKPNISHLCVFGSTTYVHVPSTKRLKLDSHTQ